MSILLSTPDQIEAWRLLALYHMLKLEMVGMHHSSGRRASVEIRKILGAAERGAPRDRTRLLAEYQAYLVELGLLTTVDQRIDEIVRRTGPLDEPYLKDA